LLKPLELRLRRIEFYGQFAFFQDGGMRDFKPSGNVLACIATTRCIQSAQIYQPGFAAFVKLTLHMDEPTLFGISKSYWDMLNGFANWFAAASSFLAAGMALYIANRSAKPSAKLSVGHRIIFGQGGAKPYPEFAVFRIVNTGDRPIRIIQLGWKVGLIRKRYAIQMHEAMQSSPLPIELSHGQEASWSIPLSARQEPWLEYFAKNLLTPNYRIGLWTLRAQAFTSVGFVFESKPEEGLLKRLKGASQKLATLDG